MRRPVAALIVLALLIGCQAPSATTTGTPATASPSAGIDVAAICAATGYTKCAESLQKALATWSGSLVAICEAPEGGGNVVRLDSESEADSKCSDGGLIAGSRVVKVIRLP